MDNNSNRNSEHSISRYIEGLRGGTEESAQRIWEHFFQRLIALADYKLKSSPRRYVDEEDVVQQAFSEFFRQVKNGHFPDLNDRQDLWQVLAMLVDRRAIDQIKSLNTLKSGGRNVRGESFFCSPDSKPNQGMNTLATPTPELADGFIEQLREMLSLLTDKNLQTIALLKLQGYKNREISEQLKSSERTVERCLKKIREQWREEIRDESTATA